MKIIISFNEDGKFEVNKSDNLPIFTAIGMLDLAKRVIFDNPQIINEESDEIEGQIAMEEVEV